MTRKQLARLVEHWRKTLLPEWRITLMDTPPPDDEGDDYWAVIQTKDDYLAATIHFTDDCLKRERREVEVTVVHELLHCLTRPWRQQIESIGFELGNAKAQALRAAREHEEEKLVDRLAYVLVAQRYGENGAVGTFEGKD